jgi:hypothetical protein
MPHVVNIDQLLGSFRRTGRQMLAKVGLQTVGLHAVHGRDGAGLGYRNRRLLRES